MKRINSPIESLALLTIAILLISSSSTKADVVFGFSPQPGDYAPEAGSFDHRGTLTRDGITATLTAHSDAGLFAILGKVNLSSSGIGISIDDAATNDTFRIDLSQSDEFGDVNERLLLSFDQTVKLTSLSLNGLGVGSQAELISAPEAGGTNAGLLSGSANVIDTYDLNSSNIILDAGQQIGIGYLSGGGFRVDSFSVIAVPEPSGIGFVAFALFGFALRRTRRD